MKFILLVAVLCVIACSSVQVEAVESGANLRVIEKQILDTILNGYDPRIRPNGVNESEAVTVRVNMYLRNVEQFDAQGMMYKIQITFRQQWHDARLAYRSISNKLNYTLISDPKLIWRPDTFFSNALRGHQMDVLVPNVLVRVYPDGEVLYSSRVSLDMICRTNLRKWPFDYQECSIKLASYGYTMTDVVYEWKEGDPVQWSKSIQFSDYSLQKVATAYCNSKTNTGEYSCLKATLLLRDHGLNRVGILLMIPCNMMVILGYCSFFICPKRLATARLLYILIVLLLAATNISIYNYAYPSKATYTRAIDVFTGVCMTFIFSALMQFLVLNYARLKREQQANDVENATAEPLLDIKDKTGDDDKKQTMTKAWQRVKQLNLVPEVMDKRARLIYPILYIAFNVIYWIGYWPREPSDWQ